MPVAPTSAAELVNLVVKSGIAPATRLSPADVAALPPNPKQAAAALIQQGIITGFQAQQLLQGRHKGFRLGAHVVLDQLGRGGMGAVYLAEHQVLRRKVAVKVLVADRGDSQKLATERFLREARAAAALDHPNIVRLFDVSRHNEVPFLVMEYVEGETLQQVVDRDGGMPFAAAADLVAQAAAGLQHAHEKGFVHRDIKPANLIVDRNGGVKILDMGLARMSASDEDNLTAVFDAGAVVGTADYIAPEQALNADVDVRADIYSLGATFYTLVTGRPPFAGNVTQKLLQHQMAVAPDLSHGDETLPPELAAVVQKMLAKKPEERFQTPAEVIAALAPWLGNSPRVLAGLSRTNLARGAERNASLYEVAAGGSSSGLMPIPAGLQLADSGVVDPSAATRDTLVEVSVQTTRSPATPAPRPAPVAPAAPTPAVPAPAPAAAPTVTVGRRTILLFAAAGLTLALAGLVAGALLFGR